MSPLHNEILELLSKSSGIELQRLLGNDGCGVIAETVMWGLMLYKEGHIMSSLPSIEILWAGRSVCGGGGYFLNESRGLSCLRTPCLVANTNNNRTIPHHGNYVCPGWHEFTMQIWGGVIFFWESISMTATNTPAPLLSTWPEHPLIIYCHILRQTFSCLLFSHLSHSHSSALFRFPTQPVFPVILFVWVSTVFLSDCWVIVAPSPLSSSRNPYISIILHNPK